jgi:hypothetical protein
MSSENLRGVQHGSVEPDDQQERPITTDWVVGFVDGEGCFSIGLVRQLDRPRRKGYRTGYQLTYDFTVTQGAKSLGCLEDLRKFFGVGHVYRNTRQDNHTEDLYQFNVSRRRDLLEVVIPFFRSHRLRTAKREDFDKFARCLAIVSDGRHTTHAGLVEILEIAQTMNRRKSRQDVIGILRGHTPNSAKADEDMVPSARRRAGTHVST